MSKHKAKWTPRVVRRNFLQELLRRCLFLTKVGFRHRVIRHTVRKSCPTLGTYNLRKHDDLDLWGGGRWALFLPFPLLHWGLGWQLRRCDGKKCATARASPRKAGSNASWSSTANFSSRSAIAPNIYCWRVNTSVEVNYHRTERNCVLDLC